MSGGCLCCLSLLALVPGCSLILDFSDSAGVHDAPPPDAFYSAAECAFDEPNDTFAAAAAVTPTDTGPAAICPTGTGIDDVDYYTFTVPDGTTAVTLQLVYQPRGATGDLELALYDATQTAVATVDDFETTKTIACPSTTVPACGTLAAGAYTFEVSPSTPGNVNDYTFSIAIQ